MPVLLFITTFPVLAGSIAYPINFFPEIVTNKEFGDFKYYIVWQYDIDYHSYLSLYKCKKESYSCSWLYSDSIRQNWDKILVDEKKKEVSIVRGSDLGLAYTDGENPRRYEVDSVQLGNHVYQMAIDDREFWKCMGKVPSCDSYTYTLYKCDLDYLSCDPLPVQYTTTYENVIFLDANEVTNEINASDDSNNLIFTYGVHPTCYVDWCVILDH